ncbi:hypothetical protein N431DRAFT_111360 [Stipitochalara longipes BDJ]|nr:hypothetical protein N431DRAFT_111360 [Stipitochalara longipes BDJ]
MAKNAPRDFTLYYCAPHHRDIPSSALSIVQQSQQISLRRPIPRSCMMTIVQHYLPAYNYLAAGYKCVQHAVVGFAAYNHYQVTKNDFAQELCIKQTTIALKKLQEEIDHFSPNNVDAIITCSLFLAGTAQDWDQWSVFVDGYSSALNYITSNKLSTAYPALLSDAFQMRRFSQKANLNAVPLPRNNETMKHRVKEITESICNILQLLGLEKWKAIGFADLEKLAFSVEAALDEDSDAAAYHRLAWLRTWMFWIDLRRTTSGDEQVALSAHFYALVLVVVPLFPAKYFEGLIEVCFKKIEGACEVVVNEKLGLEELLESARASTGRSMVFRIPDVESEEDIDT